MTLAAAVSGCEIWAETGDYCPEPKVWSNGDIAVASSSSSAEVVEFTATATDMPLHNAYLRVDYELYVTGPDAEPTSATVLELVADAGSSFVGDRTDLVLRTGGIATEGRIFASERERSCNDAPCTDTLGLRFAQPERNVRPAVQVAWHAAFSAYLPGCDFPLPLSAELELLPEPAE